MTVKKKDNFKLTNALDKRIEKKKILIFFIHILHCINQSIKIHASKISSCSV